MKNATLLFQTHTRKELATLYRCSPKAFDKMMKPFKAELGPHPGRLFSPRQVRIIVKKLGKP